jgi:hypothetical protein
VGECTAFFKLPGVLKHTIASLIRPFGMLLSPFVPLCQTLFAWPMYPLDLLHRSSNIAPLTGVMKGLRFQTVMSRVLGNQRRGGHSQYPEKRLLTRPYIVVTSSLDSTFFPDNFPSSTNSITSQSTIRPQSFHFFVYLSINHA